jgi:hypothetical protein
VATMPPPLRKLALTVHVATSVGWIGAVAVFLALAVVGLVSADPSTVRGVYLVMEPLAWAALVPLSLASLATGIIQSLGTPWGLLGHYWVIFKLVFTVIATGVLLMYMETFKMMSQAAADPANSAEALRSSSPALHAAAALVVLFTTLVLAIYKPRGETRFGRRGATAPKPGSATPL